MADISQNNSRIARNTLMLYIRMFFMMAIALYTSRVVLNTLGVDDFGIYNVVGGFVTMFTFLNAAMAGATQRFLNIEIGTGNHERLSRVFSTSVNIHLIIALIILVLAETVGLWFVITQLKFPPERQTAALWVYQFSILSTVFAILSVPYNATIIARERMGAFAYISMLEAVLKLGIVYLLVIGHLDKLKLYALLIFLVQVIITSTYNVYCYRRFPESHYRRIWEKPLMKEMISFAGWNLFGNLSVVGFTQGVNVLLNIFFGPAVNAARGVAVQVQSAIRGFTTNFQTAVNPQIVKTYAVRDFTYMHKLIFTSTKLSHYLLWVISLPVLFETQQVLVWWLKTVPDHTVAFVRLMLLIAMVEGIANPLITGANATGRIRTYQIIVGSLLLCIVPVSYAALKLGAPPEGVFVVHLAMALIAHGARMWMSRPLIHLSIRRYTVRVLVPIAVSSAVSLILPAVVYKLMDPGLMRFLLVSLACVVSSGIVIYGLGLSPGERTFARDKVQTALRKLTRH